MWSEADRIQWREQWRRHAVPTGHELHPRGARIALRSNQLTATVLASGRQHIGADIEIESAWVRYDDETFSRFENLYLFEDLSEDPERCWLPTTTPELACCLPSGHPGEHT